MNSHQWQLLIVALLVFNFVFDKFLSYLNSNNKRLDIPDEMKDVLDEKKYLLAGEYQKENGKISLISSIIMFLLMLSAIVFGLFGKLENFISLYSESLFIQTGLFFLIVSILSQFINLPFSIYQTFKIEEKYGFNKTSAKTFIFDFIKSNVLSVVLGGGILYLILYIYQNLNDGFWIWAWGLVVLIILLINLFYTDLILPIFNKLTPLSDSELKSKIAKYAEKIGYNLKNIYVIDGSKRSTKANAFFSGLGPKKTIALYDTLVEGYEEEEIVAVLAHEVGHYKKKHITYSLLISILQIGLTLFLLELFINQVEISLALGGNHVSFALGVIGFSVIYSPISLMLSVLMNFISRKNEFEADEYAKISYGSEYLISGLKKMSVDSMSNLYPHPWFVFVHYSHPPLLERIKALRVK